MIGATLMVAPTGTPRGLPAGTWRGQARGLPLPKIFEKEVMRSAMLISQCLEDHRF